MTFENNHHSLCIGFIPAKNRSEHISVGGPEGSGTKEIYLQFFFDDKIVTEDKKMPFFAIKKSSLWNEKSKLWRDVALYAEKKLTNGKYKLSSRRLARCYLLPLEEADSSTGVKLVSGPRDGGEFHNETGLHSGKYYFRFESVANGEFTDENIYVIQ